jgi:hypothetical protein
MHWYKREMAEGMGFEPTIGFNPYNGLANRRLQPLGHPSALGKPIEWRGLTTYAGPLLAGGQGKVKPSALSRLRMT